MLEFSNDDDLKTFMSLRSLCKSNNGFWKSAKQRNFLFGAYTKAFDNRRVGADMDATTQMKKYFGVDLRPGEVAVELTGLYRWNDYGSRSLVPALIIFMVDANGVSRQYKVGGRGNLRDGWSPDPAKCKLEWERDTKVAAPVFEEAAPAEKNPGEWLAPVGHKVTALMTIERVRDLGFGQYGRMVITVLKDAAGNIVNVWKDLGEAGQQLTLTGTVKECGEYRGTKQTTLIRVKVA